jgi:hypothetical protein
MPRGRPRKTDDDDVLLKSAELLGWALGGLEREIAHTRERLSVLTKQATKLRDRLATGAGSRGETAAASMEGPGGGAGGRRRRRRTMSAEARKRISEMMKKRWAERRKRNA